MFQAGIEAAVGQTCEGTVLGAGVGWEMTGVRVESWAQFILLDAEAGRKIQVGHRFEKGTISVCQDRLVCKSGS